MFLKCFEGRVVRFFDFLIFDLMLKVLLCSLSNVLFGLCVIEDNEVKTPLS